VLTHAGELALPPARDVFASLQQSSAIASARRRLHTGRLRIGSIGTSSSLRCCPRCSTGSAAAIRASKCMSPSAPTPKSSRT
jgi:DNA-binding transcriptional LysR family regulator